MPSLHRRLRNRHTRMLVQLGAMTTGVAATLLIAHDEPASRAIGTAVLAIIAIVAIKLALVAINSPGQGTNASRSGTSADQRSKFDEIAACIGALEALDSCDGNPNDRSATTHFESQHVRKEVDRLQAKVDEIIARIGALEALGRGSEQAIASAATTQFELQHVREELDRLRSQVD